MVTKVRKYGLESPALSLSSWGAAEVIRYTLDVQDITSRDNREFEIIRVEIMDFHRNILDRIIVLHNFMDCDL